MNLSPEQSKQLQEQGYFYYIEPMVEQPGKEITDFDIIEEEALYWQDKEDLARFTKYHQGEKVKATWKVDCSKAIIPSERPNELLVDWDIELHVKETKEPVRVQDIPFELYDEIILYSEGYPTHIEIKDFFNSQYGEPKPVKCLECIGQGKDHISNYIKNENKNCEDCNGTGVSHYISYVYDVFQRAEEMQKLYGQDFLDGGTSGVMYKYQRLEIIVNPYCEIVRLEK